MFKGKKNASLVALALLGGLALLAYGFFFYHINQKNVRAAALGEEIALASETENLARSLTSLLSGTEAARTEFSRYFITHDSIVVFIERVERLGKNSGVAVSFSSVEEGKGRFTAYLTMEGGFANVYRFLELLEAMPYELEVARFTISVPPLPLQKEGALWEGEATIELLNFISTL